MIPGCLRDHLRPKTSIFAVFRGQKRHINIWHIHNFSVTPVTDPSGRVPRRKCLCSWGSVHTTWISDPWPPGRETPPPPHAGTHKIKLLMFMCRFVSWVFRSWNFLPPAIFGELVYIYMAKGPFCAYIFGSNLLKTGEKVAIWDPNFWA